MSKQGYGHGDGHTEMMATMMDPETDEHWQRTVEDRDGCSDIEPIIDRWYCRGMPPLTPAQ